MEVEGCSLRQRPERGGRGVKNALFITCKQAVYEI